MRFSFIKRVVFLLVVGAIGPVQSVRAFDAPCDIDESPQNGLLFVTLAAAHQVAVVGADSGTVEQRFDFPVELSGLCMSPDGTLLYVTGGGADGVLFVADAQSGRIWRTLAVGHTPCSPVLSPDGARVYVCNRFDNEVAFVDVVSGEITRRVAVTREPVAADVSPDGSQLFVANLLPAGRADQDLVSSEISVIDTAAGTVSSIPLINGAEGVRGLKVSPDGRYLFATHFVARFLASVTQIERGWVSTDGLSVIRLSDRSLVDTVLLDDVDFGFANPWALGFTDDGGSLVVSSAGAQELSLIDLSALIKRVAEQNQATGQMTYDDLSFLSGIRRRVKLAGNGPRALVMRGTTAYVANYFSDTIDVVDLSKPEEVQIRSIALTAEFTQSEVEFGEQLFHDARLSIQQWISCAACHPDGRADGLNWDLVNDGLGNPKNAKSLLQAHQTPPSMWLAVHESAEETVRHEIRSVLFAQRSEADAAAIDAYLKSLKPVPGPARKSGGLSEAARRGKEVFNAAGCIGCHPAPLYTDLRAHALGTLQGLDAGQRLDTPSLVEVWRTAPYQHDGRAATLLEVIEGNHGRGASNLSGDEKVDLCEFLKSL